MRAVLSVVAAIAIGLTTAQNPDLVKGFIQHVASLQPDQLVEQFKQYDVSGNGKISTAELKVIFQHVADVTLGEAELKTIIGMVDADGDGEVSLPETIKFLQPQLIGNDTTGPVSPSAVNKGPGSDDFVTKRRSMIPTPVLDPPGMEPGSTPHDYRHNLLRTTKGKFKNGLTTCNYVRSCGQCSALPGCVWCNDDATCYDGDADGPSNVTCSNFDYHWCPGQPCQEFNSCFECKGPMCGWCPETGSCIDLNFRGLPKDADADGRSLTCSMVTTDCRVS